MLSYRLWPLVLILLCPGCDTGYQQTFGGWSYVTIDEGHGRREYPLAVDMATFEVLDHEDYAKDKDQVFYRGKALTDVDASTFELLKGGRYARDKNQVFLFTHPVPHADIATFEELKFPYARDAKTIYCGSVPMQVQAVDEFEVRESSSSYGIIIKEEFIRQNPEYAYLDTLPMHSVVYGYGSGRTKTERFEGFKRVE